MPYDGEHREFASYYARITELDEQALFRNSDAAMYRVKEGGKNGFSIHAAAIESPSLQPKHPGDRDGAPVRPERLPEAVSPPK